ncbi:MAG TPA: N-acetylglucosamine-6-phosphate deacetylase [Pseudolysinimonas sp.]|jgi:N-acetylglucosamine-6-phosphate deacetylase
MLAGRLVLPDGRIEQGWLEIREGVIQTLELGSPPASAEVESFPGHLIGPGFLDIHVHGGAGGDVMAGTPDALRELLAFHGGHGTTSLLATTVAESREAISHALRGVRGRMDEQHDVGAAPLPEVLGAHLEGPYLSLARSGGQNAAAIRSPSIEEFEEWSELADVRMITIAPEIGGALDFIGWLAEHHPEVVVSAGHTDSGYRQLLAAAEQGVTHLTHFMSGMSPFNHREPGAAGAGLMSDRLTLDVIADLIHMDGDVLRYIVRTRGARNVALITDAVNFAGLPDGSYDKRGREYVVRDGLVRLTSNGSLAGSTLTMDRAVANVVGLGIDIADAWAMASAVPAELLGVADRKGRLAVGADADVVILDESWRVERTLVRGRTVPPLPTPEEGHA